MIVSIRYGTHEACGAVAASCELMLAMMPSLPPAESYVISDLRGRSVDIDADDIDDAEDLYHAALDGFRRVEDAVAAAEGIDA